MIEELLHNIRLQTYFSLLAGLAGLVFLNRLSFWERLIILVVWLNVIADFLSNYIGLRGDPSVDVYNVMNPIEHSLTLIIYRAFTKHKKTRSLHLTFAYLILILASVDFAWITKTGQFHYASFLFSGIVVAIFSFLFMRSWIIESGSFKTFIPWFGIANLLYYTLMVASLSALPKAMDISDQLAKAVLWVNYGAYMLWSIILTIGLTRASVKRKADE